MASNNDNQMPTNLNDILRLNFKIEWDTTFPKRPPMMSSNNTDVSIR